MVLENGIDLGVQDQQHRSDRHTAGEVVILVKFVGKPHVVEEIGETRRDGPIQVKDLRDGLLAEAQHEEVDVTGDDVRRVPSGVERRQVYLSSPVQTARHCGRPGVQTLVMHSWCGEFDGTAVSGVL